METSVRNVSTYTQRNVVRIDAIAIAIGARIAGSVPKTKRRMTSAPAPPITASTRTLGPVSLPCDSNTAACPVTCAVTPSGVASASALRISSIGGKLENDDSPEG